MPHVKDPALAAMDAIAMKEFRVRVGVMVIREYKIFAADEKQAKKRVVEEGQGRETSRGDPKIVSVQAGVADGAITDTQAEEVARIVENAQAQKDFNVKNVKDA